jgi:hypothetical protein
VLFALGCFALVWFGYRNMSWLRGGAVVRGAPPTAAAIPPGGTPMVDSSRQDGTRAFVQQLDVRLQTGGGGPATSDFFRGDGSSGDSIYCSSHAADDGAAGVHAPALGFLPAPADSGDGGEGASEGGTSTTALAPPPQRPAWMVATLVLALLVCYLHWLLWRSQAWADQLNVALASLVIRNFQVRDAPAACMLIPPRTSHPSTR